MAEYRENFKGRPGHSYGLEKPVRFDWAGSKNGWVVYNFKTGKVYARNLESWEAPGRCIEENEQLGFGCQSDIAAIDSTP